MAANGLLGFCLALLSTVAIADSRWSLEPEGYGPIRIGMTVAEANAVLHTPLRPADGETPNRDCYQLQADLPLPSELFFMVQDDRIVRISIYGPPSEVTTERGIRVGDDIAAVRAAYGDDLDDEEHEYLGPAGRYLTWWDLRHEFGIRFETTPEGRVDTIHAGDESIQLVEGCS